QFEGSGRAVTYRDRVGGEILRLVDAQGQTWSAQRIPGAASDDPRRIWSIPGNPSTSYEGRLRLGPDGRVVIERGANDFISRNSDGSVSTFNAQLKETERRWENGAYIRYNEQGQITETRERNGPGGAAGPVRTYRYE